MVDKSKGDQYASLVTHGQSSPESLAANEKLRDIASEHDLPELTAVKVEDLPPELKKIIQLPSKVEATLVGKRRAPLLEEWGTMSRMQQVAYILELDTYEPSFCQDGNAWGSEERKSIQEQIKEQVPDSNRKRVCFTLSDNGVVSVIGWEWL